VRVVLVVGEEPLGVSLVEFRLVDVGLGGKRRRLNLLREALVDEIAPRSVLEEVLERPEFVVQTDEFEPLRPTVRLEGLEVPAGDVTDRVDPFWRV